jgi:hypothetical protein
MPKLRLDPPINIILGDSTFASRESFFISEKNNDFDARGVGGKNNSKQNNVIVKHIKPIILNMNFFILRIPQN